MQPAVYAYYEQLGEVVRLTRDPIGQLEYLRTRELIERLLPREPANVLDVGGDTGVHAQWLAELGHLVHVVDPVREHVSAAARLPGVTAELGDARHLPVADASYDVVLMLGPMYHLHERAERVQAWREAMRVARPGALLAAAAILRHASLLDFASMARLDEQNLARIERTLATGEHDPALGFTDAYFHTAAELADEARAAEAQDVQLLPVEGPGILAVRAVVHAGAVVSEELMDSCVRLARRVEGEPELLPVGSHVLATARAR